MNEDIKVGGAMIGAERVEKYWDAIICEQKSEHKL